MSTPSLDQLTADAQAISGTGSPKIKAYALDTIAYLSDREAQQAALASALAAAQRDIAALQAAIAAGTVPAAPAMPTTALVVGPPVPVGAILFAEDFAAQLDTAKWDIKNRTNAYSGTTFIPANVTVHDGLLDIAATKDSTGKWFGGEIQAKPSYIGPRYMEAKAKLPVGAGTWPAPLWELDAPQPPNWTSIGIENDVNETLGKEPTKYHVTVHNGQSLKLSKTIDTGVDLSLDFHCYGSAVYADHVDYYFDGKKLATITQAETGWATWRFTTTPMVCLVDLDMGGSWAGPVSVSPPLHLLVDYVKVWALA